LEEKAIEGGHSTSVMAGRFASVLRAKKLILTHFSMRYTTAGEDEIGVDALVKVSDLISVTLLFKSKVFNGIRKHKQNALTL